MATGAVITGRRTFEFAGGWAGDHHDGVPIFVLTRAAPPGPPPGSARYVTDIASCVAEAKAAAGDRDVLLHGAATAQECLRAGLLDEMQLSVVPVLLGQGRRLFADLPRARRAGARPGAGRARACNTSATGWSADMAIRLDMTMSLDGYVVGPNDSVDAPMGDGGFRLFNWLDRRERPGSQRPGRRRGDGHPRRDRRAADVRARGPAGRATTTTASRSSSSPTRSRPSRRRAASATSPTSARPPRRPAPPPGTPTSW